METCSSTMREKNRKLPIYSPLWAAGPGQDLVLDLLKIGPQGLAHLFVKFGSILGLNEQSLNLDLVLFWSFGPTFMVLNGFDCIKFYQFFQTRPFNLVWGHPVLLSWAKNNFGLNQISFVVGCTLKAQINRNLKGLATRPQSAVSIQWENLISSRKVNEQLMHRHTMAFLHLNPASSPWPIIYYGGFSLQC